MVKGGLKRKKADKAKNQLKVSKKGAKKARAKGGDIKLPKGLNVTNATFKTQKLVLLNQTKPTASNDDLISGLVTKKKLGLKEVLAKLNNLSVSTRLDGLEGLKELVVVHRNIIDENLSLIVNRLVPFLTEREDKLRHFGVPLLESILAQVNPSSLESLYPLISAHLCCGLSHINEDIQLESIRVLDSIIESQPEFIISHVHQILPNCMEQISITDSNSITPGSLYKNGEKRITDNKMGAKLRNNINENVSSLHWRFLVIERIHKMLLILLNKEENLNKSQFNTIYRKINDDHYSVNTAMEPFYMGLYGDKNHQNTLENSSTNDSSLNSKSLSAVGLAKQLFPTLVDTWNEATSDTLSNKRKKLTVQSAHFLVQNDSVPILISIIKTLKSIMKLAKHEEKQMSAFGSTIQREFGIEYVSKVMENFPYEVSHMTTDQRKNKKDSTLTKTISSPNFRSFDLNLCVVSFFIQWLALQENDSSRIERCRMAPKNPFKIKLENNSSTSLESILSYFNSIPDLTSELQVKNKMESSLTEVLKDISQICTEDKKATGLFNNLVSNLYNANPKNKEVINLMCYLMKHSTQEKSLNSIYEQFVLNLPNMLLSEDVTIQHLEIIQLLLKTNNQTLLSVIIENLQEFPSKLSAVIEVITSAKEKDEKLLDEYLKTVAIIFSNTKVQHIVQIQDERWKQDLKGSTKPSAASKLVLPNYCFCTNVLISLQD